MRLARRTLFVALSVVALIVTVAALYVTLRYMKTSPEESTAIAAGD